MNRDFEGSNRPPSIDLPHIGFDIETYSPDGFPEDGDDPVIAATLALSENGVPRKGLLLVSLIYPPRLADRLLTLLRSFLSASEGDYLVTYNGTLFGHPYLLHRGEIYGIDFDDVFSSFDHLDLYRVVRHAKLRLPSYGQKAIERVMGIDRVVNDVSGSSYHRVFNGFLRSGSLKPSFYNMEDSGGCLRILNNLTANDKKSCI